MLEQVCDDNYLEVMQEIIDEYFNTKNNSRSRELTIHLFLSRDDDNTHTWIDTIYKRLYGEL